MTRSLPWLLALLLGLSVGCPGDDDDSAAVDDDDSAADDDDAANDDDVADDDDDDDDDDDTTAGQDYDAATVPAFGDCDPAQNQFKLMLGDGSEVGPFSGFDSGASFANNNGNWTLRMGSGATFNQLQGQRTGYVLATAIPMQGPAGNEGNVVSNVLIDLADLGGSAAAMGGGYGLPNLNADDRVMGEVTFSVLPEPSATATGTFSAVLQHNQQLGAGNVVLLGIRGCFQAPLSATD